MRRVLFIITIISGILAVGCSKENSNEFVPYPDKEINDTNWYSVVPQSARVRQLDSIFAILPQSDSIDISTGGTLHFDSLRILFPPGFCTGVGGATAGKVKIEVTSLRTKGDMVRTDRPTMNYEKLLVTGGALNISATYNGSPVTMAQGKVIKVSLISRMSNATPSNNMRVFYGKEDAYPAAAVQNFTWIPADGSTSFVSSFTDSASGFKGYELYATRFGWVNCDYFSDTTQPRTKVSIALPANFTNANTNVYAVLQSPDIVAQLIGNPVTKTFNINNIYTGKVVTFVTMSFIDGKIYLGSKLVTITPNMNLNITPEIKTKQQVEAFLGSL
jgi:hypothetical protein